MLSANLTSLVSKRTRERGRDYFAARRATVVKGNAWRVDATVQGSRLYDVNLVRERDAIEAWCSCPYCEDQYEPCKHIWATLLAAEARGYLQGDGRRTVRQLELVPPDDGDDLEDEGWFETPEPFPRSRPRHDIAMNAAPVPSTAAEGPGVEADPLAPPPEDGAAPAIRPATLPPGHEIVYVVDRPAPWRAMGWCSTWRHATARGTANGASPRAGFTSDEIAHLPDPADRQAMAILSGGREQVSNYYYGSSYHDSAPARFRLTHALDEVPSADDLRHGPLPAAGIGDGRSIAAAELGRGGPWEFWLQVAPDEAGKRTRSPASSGAARSGWGWRSPLLLPGGLVFWEDRVARCKTSMRSTGWRCCDARVADGAGQAKAGVARGIAPAAGPPPARPAGGAALRGGGADAPASPEGEACETRGRMSDREQNWLVGELSFDYDGEIVPAQPRARSVFKAEERRLLLPRPGGGGPSRPTAAARLPRRTELLPERGPGAGPAQPAEGRAALLPGGLARRGRGQALPPGGRLQDRGPSGHRLVRAARRRAASAIRTAPLPELLAALKRGENTRPARRRHLRHAARGVAEEVRPARRPGQRRRATTSASRATQVGLLDALLAAQPEVDVATSRSSRRASGCAASQGIAPPTRRRRSRASCAATSATAWAGSHFLREFGFGGCLADDMGLGKTVQVLALLDAPPRAADRSQERRPPSLVVVPRSLVFNWKQEAARFAPELRVLDHTGIGRGKTGRALRRLRPGPHHLRHAAPRRRSTSRTVDFDYVHPRRGAGDQERRAAESAKAARLLAGRPPPGAERHADREPPRRAVEPLRVPQPGHARHGRRSSSTGGAAAQSRRGDPRAARRGPAAVHPPPHQGAGRQGAAARRPSRRSTASSSPRSASSTTSCAITTASRCSARIDARRHRARRRSSPRSAAAPAPGRLPPGLDRQGRASSEPSAKLDVLLPQLERSPRRGAQGAGLLAVHQPAGDRPRAARRREASPTNTSTAARATGRRGSSGSRTTRTASCS